MHPKPFMRMENGLSLLQQTLQRAQALPGVEYVLTVTNRDFFFQTEDHYRGVARVGLQLDYLLEPVARNTAAAVAAAALEAEARWGADVFLLVLPADHVVRKPEGLAKAVAQALALAVKGFLVTFGIAPTSPETGFGYIAQDQSAPLGENAWKIARFVEKPAPALAEQFLAEGLHTWNSGMFCFTAGSVLREFRAHAPNLLEAVAACNAVSSRREDPSGGFMLSLEEARFAAVANISFDCAVMEHTAYGAVIPCDPGWSDIGSWTAWAAQQEPDAQGNVVQGQALLHDVSDCYIQSDSRMVAALGVDNLIVVDSPDALLVAHRTRAQEVRHLVARLAAAGHESARLHRTVHRPWGTYTVLEEGPRFKIKRLVVRPGASLSLQMHHHRNEHWIVVSGMARVINGEQEMFVSTNESTYIPAGHRHRLSNPGKLELVMIEVQSGDYLGEDDILRFDVS